MVSDAVREDRWIAKYAAYSKTQSGLSKKTISDYISDVRRFAKWLVPTHKRIEHAEESDIVQYISEEEDRGLAPGTIARRLYALRHFYAFMVTRDACHDDPTANIPAPEDDDDEQTVHTKEEVSRILQATRGPCAIRNKAMLRLYYHGLKRGELTALNRNDLDVEKGVCRVGERTIRLDSETLAAVRAYVASRAETKEPALFLTARRTRLTPRQAWNVAKEAGLVAGIDQPVNPASLLRSFRMHWIQDGRDPVELAQILGTDIGPYINRARRDADADEAGEAFRLSGLSDELFESLDMRRVQHIWDKIIERSQNDAEGAITATRTLLEGIAKTILTHLAQPPRIGETLSGMCKNALVAVLPIDAKGDTHFTNFARRASGLVDQLSLYRNAASDAHATRNLRAIERHQARYAVGLAASTAAFLIHCYSEYLAKAPDKEGGRAKVLLLSAVEREQMQTLLQSARRRVQSEDRAAVDAILEHVAMKKGQRFSANRGVYLLLSRQQIALMDRLIRDDLEGPKTFAKAGARVGAKLAALMDGNA